MKKLIKNTETDIYNVDIYGIQIIKFNNKPWFVIYTVNNAMIPVDCHY